MAAHRAVRGLATLRRGSNSTQPVRTVSAMSPTAVAQTASETAPLK